MASGREACASNPAFHNPHTSCDRRRRNGRRSFIPEVDKARLSFELSDVSPSFSAKPIGQGTVFRVTCGELGPLGRRAVVPG
jgi:hypothetical protein